MGKKHPLDHPSTDTSGRFPLDGLLREKGWTVHSRPKGPATQSLWEKRGFFPPLLMAKALSTIDRNAVADAKMMEEIFYDQYE